MKLSGLRIDKWEKGVANAVIRQYRNDAYPETIKSRRRVVAR